MILRTTIALLLLSVLTLKAQYNFKGNYNLAGKYSFSQAVAAGGGTPSFINFTNGLFGTTTTAAVTNTFQSGDAYVVAVKWEDADRTPSVTDDLGSTYTLATRTNSSSTYSAMFYAKNLGAGSAVKTTVNMGSSTAAVEVGAWLIRGASTSAPLDQAATGSDSTGTAAATSNVNTTQATEVLCVVMMNYGGATTTPQASWTEDQDEHGAEWQHRTVTSTGTYQGAGTLAFSEQWSICLVTIK